MALRELLKPLVKVFIATFSALELSSPSMVERPPAYSPNLNIWTL